MSNEKKRREQCTFLKDFDNLEAVRMDYLNRPRHSRPWQ